MVAGAYWVSEIITFSGSTNESEAKFKSLIRVL